MKAIPYTKEAYQLLHEGAIALAKVEDAGMRIDVLYLEGAIAKTERRVKKRQARLSSSEVMKAWRSRFKDRTNFNSNAQLGVILFDVLKYECPDRTRTGKYSTSEKTLATVDDPFVQDYLAIKKLQKAGQFLKGIRAETCQGYLHPVFSLHITKTFRSSSEDPNFQNLPVRNETMRRIVRRTIIARKGRRIIETDFSGVEVRIAACLHKDPTMIRYLLDKTTDMHRDMAMECFKLSKAEVTKAIRHEAKNKFVFPEFYGSYWLNVSADLWQASARLVTESGVPLRKHLRRQGLKRLGEQDVKQGPARGTFEHHIAEVESDFWNERFPVYTQWKKDHYASYQRRGWFKTKTGFICQGFMKKNEAINYPVQGPAFHCLLWALIEIVKELRKRRMKTLVIGQIHDSVVADVPDEEVEEYCEIVEDVMTRRLPKHWPWITVPLEIEIEQTPVDGSWVDKEKRVSGH